MARARPEDFGLTERLIEEIRARDERQARLFAQSLLWGSGALWLTLTVLVYIHSHLHTGRRDAAFGLLVALLLGGLGAGVGSLPVAVVSGVVAWLVHPPHPKAKALSRYEKATAGIRACDVCLLARADDSPKEGVTYCGRCGAWICPECRGRYDLRAIAALRRRRPPGDAAQPGRKDEGDTRPDP